MCDVCGSVEFEINTKQILGGICVCGNCVNNIVSLYILHYPIKLLCPKCNNGKDNSQKCPQCSLPQIIITEKNSEHNRA